MSGNILYINLIISFALTLFGYLSIPVIFSILGKKYGLKKIKIISVINSIVVWILFRVIQITLTGEATSGAAVFLWGAAGHWILKRNCLEEVPNKSSLSSFKASQSSDIHVCVSKENKIAHKYGRDDVPLSDLALKQDMEVYDIKRIKSEEQNETRAMQERNKVENKYAKYCSHCGNPIDPVTKQCLGCGKQYFKGIPWKKVLTVLFALLLIGSLILNIIFCIACKEIVSENTELISENEELSEKASEIQKEKEGIDKELKKVKRQFDEINELVVFVEDDGTRLYHKFLCESFKGESFWAFNIDAAEGKGYKPCTVCSDANYSPPLTWDESFNKLMIEKAVGEDYEISAEELKKLPIRELSWLMSDDVVFICSSWKGLYHSISCDRLTGNCTVTIQSIAKADGFKPCSMCQ